MAIIRLQSAKEKAQGVYYEIDTNNEPLGTGGMGQVHRGVCVHVDSGVRVDVAIKFLYDDLPKNVIERAKREASIQIHNENLIEMFGFVQIDEIAENGEVHPRYHVVSELLDGVMLFDLLKGNVVNKKGEVIPYAQELYRKYQEERPYFAIHVIKKVLSGIMALHDKGYIHRDIDPSNIMVTSDGKIKVIDFGIAKKISSLGSADQQMTSAGQFMGKAAYSAPELVVGDVNHQDKNTDLYSIGIMFFQLLVGKLPFEGPTHEVLEKQLRSKMPLQEISYKAIRKVIEKATYKKQSERYQTAAEFRVAVEQLESMTFSSSEHSLKDELQEKTQVIDNVFQNFVGSRKKIIWLTASVFILCILSGSIWWINETKKEEKRLQEELAHQQEIQRLRLISEELKDSIINTSEIKSWTHPETNDTVKSVGMLIVMAKNLLTSSDSIRGIDGIGILERILAKEYVSSAEAAYLLGDIYGGRDSLYKGIVSLNPVKAFVYDSMAVSLDSTHCRALYEYGCDYMAGESRTGRKDSRDIKAAIEYFQKSYRYAEKTGDTDCAEKCVRRLKQLKVKL